MLKGPFLGFNSQQELDAFLKISSKIEKSAEVAESFSGRSKKETAEILFKLVMDYGGEGANPDEQEILNAAIKKHLNAKTIDWFMDVVANFWLKYKQTKTARRPRPKSKPTLRNQTIDSMRKWIGHNQSISLRDFIANSSSSSDIEPLIEFLGVSKGGKYSVSLGDFPEQKVALSTLESWWTVARKNCIP